MSSSRWSSSVWLTMVFRNNAHDTRPALTTDWETPRGSCFHNNFVLQNSKQIILVFLRRYLEFSCIGFYGHNTIETGLLTLLLSCLIEVVWIEHFQSRPQTKYKRNIFLDHTMFVLILRTVLCNSISTKVNKEIGHHSVSQSKERLRDSTLYLETQFPRIWRKKPTLFLEQPDTKSH